MEIRADASIFSPDKCSSQVGLLSGPFPSYIHYAISLNDFSFPAPLGRTSFITTFFSPTTLISPNLHSFQGFCPTKMHLGEHHNRDAFRRLRESVQPRQHHHTPRLPEQNQHLDGRQERSLISGIEHLPGGAVNMLNGILAGRQANPNAGPPAHAQPTPSRRPVTPAQPTPSRRPVRTTEESSPTQTQNPANQSPEKGGQGASSGAPQASFTTSFPPATQGNDPSSQTTNVGTQATPTPTSGGSTGGRVDAESNISSESHNSSANQGAGNRDITSVWTGEGLPPAVATDSNGNTIVFETGRPTGDRPPPTPLPTVARVGIGLVVICAVLGMVIACFYFQRKRRRAMTEGRRQRWWDTRRPRSIEYTDGKDSKPLMRSAQSAQVPTSERTGPFLGLFSQANVPFTFLKSPAPAEVRNLKNSIDYTDSSSSSSPRSSGSHYVGRFSLAQFSIGSLDSQDSSLCRPAVHHQAVNYITERERRSSSMQHPDFAPLKHPEEAAIDRTSAGRQPRAVTASGRSSISSGSVRYSGYSIQSTINITPELRPKTSMSGSSVSTMDPFLDPAHQGTSDLVGKTTVRSATADLMHLRGISMSSSVATDPFAESIIASTCYGFEEYETVRVPVIGNLSDELSLRRGEEVRVLKVFEDGWAMVEKANGSQAAERGFVPVNCLRDSSPLSGGASYPRRVDSYTTSSANIR